MSDTTDKSKTQLAQEFAQATDKVKEMAEELKGKMENGEKLSQSAVTKADEALVAMNELKARLDDLEQKAYRRAGDGEPQYKSMGEEFVNSQPYLDLKDNQGHGRYAKLEIKATITSSTTDTNGSAGVLVTPHRVNGIITPPNQRLTMRDLIMPGTLEGNSVLYQRETGFTNNANAQSAEGEKLAQSDIKYDEQSVAVKTIGHFIKVSSQILEDASQLQSNIDGRLYYGLKLNEDRQILNGDGLGGNLKGIMPQATDFADPTSLAKYSKIDQLRLAILQVALAEYPANGFVLNPIDWATIELAKDGNGNYIIGNPQGAITPALWRLPVVETKAIGLGKFLTGAFDLGAQLYDRKLATVEAGFENDDFTRLLITLRATERLALAVYRPEAFIKGTLAEKG